MRDNQFSARDCGTGMFFFVGQSCEMWDSWQVCKQKSTLKSLYTDGFCPHIAIIFILGGTPSQLTLLASVSALDGRLQRASPSACVSTGEVGCGPTLDYIYSTL